MAKQSFVMVKKQRIYPKLRLAQYFEDWQVLRSLHYDYHIMIDFTFPRDQANPTYYSKIMHQFMINSPSPLGLEDNERTQSIHNASLSLLIDKEYICNIKF